MIPFVHSLLHDPTYFARAVFVFMIFSLLRARLARRA
jgi:hypothetical protein